MSRDYDVLQDIADRLTATNQFDGVWLSGLPEDRGRPAGDLNAAVVSPRDWTEDDAHQDVAGAVNTRQVKYDLTLIVRREDAEIRDRELDRLLNVAQNALDGVAFLDICIAPWSKLTRGKHERPAAPERRMSVTGAYAYHVIGDDNHDEAD